MNENSNKTPKNESYCGNPYYNNNDFGNENYNKKNKFINDDKNSPNQNFNLNSQNPNPNQKLQRSPRLNVKRRKGLKRGTFPISLLSLKYMPPKMARLLISPIKNDLTEKNHEVKGTCSIISSEHILGF